MVILVISVVAVLAIALGVGIGVGVHNEHNAEQDRGSIIASAASTSRTAPTAGVSKQILPIPRVNKEELVYRAL